MKVVLFCGGQGMRLRDYSATIPKPLVEVGSKPIMWHLMKYYAHFGHKEFILCLGHGASAIKEYFLKYDETFTNDFTYAEGGRRITLLNQDISDWQITFVDTGKHSTVGERLRRVRPHLGDDPVFLANYADGLSDLNLHDYVENFVKSDKLACLLSVPSPHTFHLVNTDDSGDVVSLEPVATAPLRINGGFFALRRELFDYMNVGEDLVLEPFQRLIEIKKLRALSYDGFWQNMDTLKDKITLDGMVEHGPGPWQVWRR